MRLFTPGPVQVSKNVSDASAKPVLFHRAKGFERLYGACIKSLSALYDSSPNEVIMLLGGSGTYANEAMIHSLITDRDRVLLFSNGDFGNRLEKMLQLHKKNFQTLQIPHGEIFNQEEIEAVIEEYKPTIVIMVALETSTGIVNPVHYLGELSIKYKYRLFVDAVSALGAEDISVKKDHIAACTSVPNKAVESLPGLSFICVSNDLLEETKDVTKTSMYLDLHKYYEFNQRNQTPVTPPVTLIYALNKALDSFQKEGLQNRINRYRKLSKFVREEIKKLGLKVLNAKHSEAYAANAISCMQLPNEINAKELHNFLFDQEHTLWFYQHPEINFQDNVMQISVMGDVTQKDLEELFKLIGKFVRDKTN